MDADDQGTKAPSFNVEEGKIALAAAILHGCIAALDGPEFLSRERRAQVAEQLRALVEFIERLGGHLA